MSSVATEHVSESFPVAPVRRFTRKEYDALVESGFFEDEKVELLDGVIYEMTPQGGPHSKPILRLTMLLAPALVGRADVGVQLPFAASDTSEPEPDLFIVPRDEENEDHPSRAFCVIEVAVTSQRRDRMKVRIYAENGVPQLILIDVPRREARIYREPRDGDYGRVETLREGERVVIDAFPDVAFDLKEVLPRVVPTSG
ncbi:MAG TPA: Uma2 family endonuclease [Myxococcota bacterium]|nr:Uma2 family endonuclease [Myxococcota bacterium]